MNRALVGSPSSPSETVKQGGRPNRMNMRWFQAWPWVRLAEGFHADDRDACQGGVVLSKGRADFGRQRSDRRGSGVFGGTLFRSGGRAPLKNRQRPAQRLRPEDGRRDLSGTQ